MNYSDKVDSVIHIIKTFYTKKNRWPSHQEVLLYLVAVHKVKRETALEYLKEALLSKNIFDMVSHIEVR